VVWGEKEKKRIRECRGAWHSSLRAKKWGIWDRLGALDGEEGRKSLIEVTLGST